MSSIPEEFTSDWYDENYFKTPKGKKFKRPNGSLEGWSYANPNGESPWFEFAVKAWKEMFHPKTMLDVGCGRGTVVAYARDLGIEAFGFDFSEWAVKEGRYPRCKRAWLTVHDATKPWPYSNDSFDLLIALDFYEHIYDDSIDFVVKEMYRVAKKWIFLQIATVNVINHLGSGVHLPRKAEEGYILRKGEPVPIEREGNAVAGHVTVQPEEFWLNRFEHDDWMSRRDMVNWFTALLGQNMNKNWLLNTMIVLERI